MRGPSFPARRLVGAPGAPLLLPPLNLVGDYSLDGIRLADGTTNETLLEGTPSSVPVHVFDEVLISRVTSRPLTLEEIQGKGIVIDEQNFRAIEFEVGFVLDGKTIPVRFPVVTPAATSNTEIIPAAELEERLRQVEEINDQLSQGVVIPPELETSQFNMQVKGLNFQFVDPGEGEDLGLSVPPIPALMVIPGNIGFLNQFFSVMIFTENGAPAGSALSATNIAAELVLPTGPDRVAGTFPQPGDDPLRFARVGEAAVIQPVQPVRQLGPDGKLGTPDDVPRLQPGETGQGEFLVEGLQEGLHVMDLKLTADLEGLAAGVVKIEGRAAGSVLVRNPKFSFAFAHPRTVRAGEPYDAFVTILNTSQVPANLVSVTLNSLSISGGVLESDETVELGTISPGQTAMAKFRIRSQRTGAITFSNITTSDDSLVGRFRLHAGVDERGVALSPDTLVLPNFVDELPADLLDAANRVLGQALSVAKAGQPPARRAAREHRVPETEGDRTCRGRPARALRRIARARGARHPARLAGRARLQPGLGPDPSRNQCRPRMAPGPDARDRGRQRRWSRQCPPARGRARLRRARRVVVPRRGERRRFPGGPTERKRTEPCQVADRTRDARQEFAGQGAWLSGTRGRMDGGCGCGSFRVEIRRASSPRHSRRVLC